MVIPAAPAREYPDRDSSICRTASKRTDQITEGGSQSKWRMKKHTSHSFQHPGHYEPGARACGDTTKSNSFLLCRLSSFPRFAIPGSALNPMPRPLRLHLFTNPFGYAIGLGHLGYCNDQRSKIEFAGINRSYPTGNSQEGGFRCIEQVVTFVD